MDCKVELILWLSCIGFLSGPQVKMAEGLECDTCYRAKGISGKCIKSPCNSYEDHKKSAEVYVDLLKKYSPHPNAKDSYLIFREDTGTYVCVKSVQTTNALRQVNSHCQPVSSMMDPITKINNTLLPRSEPYNEHEFGKENVLYGQVFVCDEKNVAQCLGKANIPVRPVGILGLITFCCFGFLIKVVSTY